MEMYNDFSFKMHFSGKLLELEKKALNKLHCGKVEEEISDTTKTTKKEISERFV